MRIGVVHTFESPCICHRFILAAMSDLGHETLEVSSEDLFLHLEALVACDAVFEHVDTFLGRASLRAYPRALLDAHGAFVAGSSAQACLLADDKIRARRLFSDIGIPIPDTLILSRPNLPAGATYPRVLKPAFEHCSRGLVLARNEQEFRSHAAALFERYREPLLAEEFIPGRELAISVVGNHPPQCLPIFEVEPLSGASAASVEVYSYEAKFETRGQALWSCPRPARLPGSLTLALQSMALKAYKAFGLRDYARFDLRLRPDGRPFFLEANAKPSVEAGTFLPFAAAEMGWSLTELLRRILDSAQQRRVE